MKKKTANYEWKMIFYTKGGQSQASSADYGTKVRVIKANAHKYSISAMCKCLKIPRSSYYSYREYNDIPEPLSEIVARIFNANQRVYGTRKIKIELMKQGYRVSRRRIARIMRCNGLVSVYTVKKYKVSHTSVNEAEVSNEINREFNDRGYKE